MFTTQQQQEQTSRTIQTKSGQRAGVSQFKDNRPVSTAFQTLQRFADDEEEDSLQGKFSDPVQRAEDEEEPLQGKFDGTVQRMEEDQDETLQGKFAVQREAAPNLTGMPDNLKSGVENLSGFSMDSVRVHYNSSKPATVQALAYTQGTDIHVAPGQEKHLPHEAWHVAQQMAGRVAPITNVNGMPVNDNAGLEHEADVMGTKALFSDVPSQLKKDSNLIHNETAIQRTKADFVARLGAIKNLAGVGITLTQPNIDIFECKIKELGGFLCQKYTLKRMSYIWREITNLYFQTKKDWGIQDKVSVVLKTKLNDMDYKLEAVYSKSEEGYIERETKQINISHYMEGYNGTGKSTGNEFDTRHTITDNTWSEDISNMNKKTGDTSSKAIAESGRFEAIMNDMDPNDNSTYNIVPNGHPITNVVDDANLNEGAFTVTPAKLWPNYHGVWLMRCYRKLKQDQDKNPKNGKYVEGMEGSGDYKRLPVYNWEVYEAMANCKKGKLHNNKSEILNDVSGKKVGTSGLWDTNDV